MYLDFNKSKFLPASLTALINRALEELRLCAESVLSPTTQRRLQTVLKQIKKGRGAPDRVVENICSELYEKLKKLPPEVLEEISHFIAVALELINTSESAYRTYRLKDRPAPHSPQGSQVIEYVLTAHPTESRRPEIVFLLKKIQFFFEAELARAGSLPQGELRYLLKILLRTPLAKQAKPTVEDEIDYIFLSVLQKANLETLTSENFRINFKITTWVGGDKDGHPGVNQMTALASLRRSRLLLGQYFEGELRDILRNLQLLHNTDLILKDEIEQAHKLIRNCRKLQHLRFGDGSKLVSFKKDFTTWVHRLDRRLKFSTPETLRLQKLFKFFPGLVLPLEYREAAEVINFAAENKAKAARMPIGRMLSCLSKIAGSGDPRWYVQSFVISQLRYPSDLLAAKKLIKFFELKAELPVVPLLEMEEAFQRLPEILNKLIALNRGSVSEVMLGYSDSAKEMGVLPARLHIARTLWNASLQAKKLGVGIKFFHGSGGSVSRGGGSTDEQLSWFPKAALEEYKVTVQGEMVERTFASPEILLSKLNKILQITGDIRKKRLSKAYRAPAVVAFGAAIEKSFRETVSESSFLKVLKDVTPYAYLTDLKIGSRPSKRSNLTSLKDLRAIPWVMSWTQTRILLSAWWGVGSGWQAMTRNQKAILKKLASKDPLLGSFTKQLGFTLAKVELGVWNFLSKSVDVDDAEVSSMLKRISGELALTYRALHDLSGHADSLWYRPWLEESIYFRSAMIHPLNVIAKIAHERKLHAVLRESTTGIACGMLTTG